MVHQETPNNLYCKKNYQKIKRVDRKVFKIFHKRRRVSFFLLNTSKSSTCPIVRSHSVCDIISCHSESPHGEDLDYLITDITFIITIVRISEASSIVWNMKVFKISYFSILLESYWCLTRVFFFWLLLFPQHILTWDTDPLALLSFRLNYYPSFFLLLFSSFLRLLIEFFEFLVRYDLSLVYVSYVSFLSKNEMSQGLSERKSSFFAQFGHYLFETLIDI